MMTSTLQVKLNDTLVGYLTHYQDGKNVFTFDESYIQNAELPKLWWEISDHTMPARPLFPSTLIH